MSIFCHHHVGKNYQVLSTGDIIIGGNIFTGAGNLTIEAVNSTSAIAFGGYFVGAKGGDLAISVGGGAPPSTVWRERPAARSALICTLI